MYQKNPLLILEFDPGTLMTTARSLFPHLKAAALSAKNSGRIIKRDLSRGKKFLPSLGKQVSNHIKNDPTLMGDAVRAGEFGRQAAGMFTLQKMAPLPTPDSQSVAQTFSAGKTLLSRGGSNKSAKRTANIARKAISNPGKTFKNFVSRRATLSTYAGSPINNYNGITAGLMGVTAPIIDGSATMIPAAVNGIGAKQLGQMVKNTKNAYLGAAKEYAGKIKTNLSKVSNNIKNRMPRFQPNPILQPV